MARTNGTCGGPRRTSIPQKSDYELVHCNNLKLLNDTICCRYTEQILGIDESKVVRVILSLLSSILEILRQSE